MTVALINRSIPLGGNGTIVKVPLKGRLRSLGSKYAQEKRAKSDAVLESRSPSCEYGTGSSPVSTYSREEPEVEAEIGGVTPLLAPTALRPSDKKRHGMSLIFLVYKEADTTNSIATSKQESFEKVISIIIWKRCSSSFTLGKSFSSPKLSFHGYQERRAWWDG